MTFQQKLEEVRALLVQHNSQVEHPDKNGVDVEKFFVNLTKAGGTNDQTLSQCTWEDLQDFGLPKLLARQVANIFRSKEEKKEEKPVLKKSKVEVMGVKELLSYYDPRTPASLVNNRLSEIMGTRRFIVFNSDQSVCVDASAKLAQEILDGYPERELYTHNDIPVMTYRIGERPSQSFEENPLYPGRVLRPDGDCDQTNRSWSGVPLEVKQVLYLAVTRTNEIRIASINDAHSVMDLVVGKDDSEALKLVRRRFSTAFATLKELQDQGKAPTLKIFKKASEAKRNDPFGRNHTY